jgi:PHD/YefM family antitoxin component YafN of YafNO toxin-antitoxin module
MIAIHPQYIKDTAGKNLVILPQKEFDTIMEELEDIEDVRLYDEAKREDKGERIPMEEAFKMIEVKRKNK